MALMESIMQKLIDPLEHIELGMKICVSNLIYLKLFD